MDDSNPNQELKGYSTINLNNCFEDPSMMREFVYLHQIRQHVPAAKACYVETTDQWCWLGIYPNVQQINKTFAKEWWFNNNGIMARRCTSWWCGVQVAVAVDGVTEQRAWIIWELIPVFIKILYPQVWWTIYTME